MELYSFEEVTDELIGKKGTPERDAFDAEVAEAVQAYQLGEAIKKVRLEQHLTQEELGNRIGVKKSQISKLERGGNTRLFTMGRVFRALGIPSATLDLGVGGKVTLW